MIHSTFLVFHQDLLTFYQGIVYQLVRVQIDAVQTDSGDLAVFVGGVIVDALCGVAAAGIDCFFIKLSYLYAALLLCYGSQNMKHLADTCRLRVLGHGV